MKLIYSKLALKCNPFDVTIAVTIEFGRSLLQFVITNCLINAIFAFHSIGLSVLASYTISYGFMPAAFISLDYLIYFI